MYAKSHFDTLWLESLGWSCLQKVSGWELRDVHGSYWVSSASPMKDGFMDGSEKNLWGRSYQCQWMVTQSWEVLFCFPALWGSQPLTYGEEKGGSGSEDPLQEPLSRLHFLKVPLPPKSFYKTWDPSRCGEKWSSPVCSGLPGGCQVWALDILENRCLWERVRQLSVLAVLMCGDLSPKHLILFSYDNPLHSLSSLTPIIKLN